HALLSRLEMPGLRETRVPRRIAIHADEVRERRAGDRRGEDAGIVHRIKRRLITTPRVAHVSDAPWVDVLHSPERRLHRGGHAIQSGVTRVARAEENVRTQHEVS